MEIKQYSITLVNLDPTVGSEINKTRPCVIISPNEMNKYIRTVIIAPMTSQTRDYPTRVAVKNDNKKGWIALDQIRTIDKARIVKTLDTLTTKEIEKLKLVLKEMLID